MIISGVASLEKALEHEYVRGAIGKLGVGHRLDWTSWPGVFIGRYSGGRALIEFRDGRRYVTEKSGGMIVPGGTVYRAETVEPGESAWTVTRNAFYGSVDLFLLLESPIVFGAEIGEKIDAINRELVTLHAIRRPDLRTLVRRRSLGFQLMDIMVGLCEPKPDAGARARAMERVRPALTFIEERLGRRIAMAEMAATLCLSPSRFQAVFKRAMGVSPGDYALKARMEKAQRLLASTDARMGEIAAEVGYDDPFNFSHRFKRHVGVSPTEYRRTAVLVP